MRFYQITLCVYWWIKKILLASLAYLRSDNDLVIECYRTCYSIAFSFSQKKSISKEMHFGKRRFCSLSLAYLRCDNDWSLSAIAPAPPEHPVFHKKKTPEGVYFGKTGNDLSSRLVSKQVYSALRVFTSVFGMRTGVAPLLKSPVMVECSIKYIHNYIFIKC